MKYFVIEPAIGGEMGNLAEVDFSFKPPLIHRAHAELFMQSESYLIFASPFFLVRNRLRDCIDECGITGIEWIDGEVTGSPQFEELSVNSTIPAFSFMKPVGVSGKDDVTYHTNRRFLGSEKFVTVVQSFPHRNCLFLKPAQ